jgi:ribulose-phosphate 3-epimerase
MLEIIPAIMPDTFEDVQEKAARINGLVPVAQIDVMDGAFVPSRSWPYNRNGVREFKHFTDYHERLPHDETLSYEIDMMVEDPEKALHFWLREGVTRVIVHIESTRDVTECIEKTREYSDRRVGAGGLAVAFGVALGIETPNEEVSAFIPHVDFVQCMGIAKIGFQHQPFDARVIPKISDLRASFPKCIISVDGGVNLTTAPALVAAGARRLVSGSALFGSADIAKVIREFQKLAP